MNKKQIAETAPFLALMALPNISWAQIVYQPANLSPAAIPTLTTATLLMSIILLLVAAKWMGFDRKKNLGKIVGVLGVCAIASGTWSVKLVSDAYADGGGVNFGFLSSPEGGMVPISNGVLNIFENRSGVSQQLISITLGACPDTDRGTIDGVVKCAENAVISTGEDGLCYTDCTPPPT